MGEATKIEWADATYNPWIGCTKVSPGCDHCYAEGLATARLGVEWGPLAERRRTAASTWKQPLAWNRKAAAAGERYRVFCASLADVFDNAVDQHWRRDLAALILMTPHLDWLLLTKRIGNAAEMLADMFPAGAQPNVWIGATIVNQAEADRDIPKLLAIKQLCGVSKVFLSMEPLLGPVRLDRLREDLDGSISWESCLNRKRFSEWGGEDGNGGDIDGCPAVDWVIVGGESGPGGRPMHPDWARSLRDQCAAAGVPFLFKQWGEWAPGENAPGPQMRTETGAHLSADGEWWFEQITKRMGEELHCDDEPDVWRFGKKDAGRLLDGVRHDGVPA